MPTTTKRCNQCGRDLPYSEFHLARRNNDGVQTACKTCHSARVKASRNPELVRETARRYYKANRQKVIAATKEWRKTHPDQAKATQRKYYFAHKERLAAYYRQYRQDNADVKRAYDRGYQAGRRAAVKACRCCMMPGRTAQSDAIVELGEMTEGQQRMIAAGQQVAGNFPTGLSKEALGEWILRQFGSDTDPPT